MKRGYTVCFSKAFGDAANTQTYIVRAFSAFNPATSGGGYKVTNFMKKLLFWLCLLLPVLSYAQERGTLSYLDSRPFYGEVVLGDSITKNLRKLHLLEEKAEKGGFRCEVTEKEKECYRIGGHSPLAIYVDVANYKIKNILAYFLIGKGEELEIVKALMSDFGDWAKDANGFNWYGNKVSVMSHYSDDLKTFYVFFHDVTQP